MGCCRCSLLLFVLVVCWACCCLGSLLLFVFVADVRSGVVLMLLFVFAVAVGFAVVDFCGSGMLMSLSVVVKLLFACVACVRCTCFCGC